MADKKTPVFVASADAQILHSRLMDSKPGDVITYAELSKAIGRSVVPGNAGYGSLGTARRMAQRDGVVFGCVAKVGLRHLDDAEKVHNAAADRRKSGKAARRGREKLQTADFAVLDKDQRARYAAEAAVLGLIEAAAKQTTVKRISARVAPDQKLLSLADTLEMFKG